MKENSKFDLDIQSFDIKEYLFTILSYWKLFLISVVLALFIAKVVNMTSERIYSLSSLITVKDEQNPLFTSNTNIAFNWGGPSDRVETIITILKSRSHNEKVVREMNLVLDYLAEGRFRNTDVYGRIPVMIEIDTTHFQLINTDLKLNFLSNTEVEISFEMDDEKNTLVDYSNGRTKNHVPKELNFSEVYPLNAWISSPF